MKHASPDNASFQDPAGLIPADEPVRLFRAQDLLAPDALLAYATLIEEFCTTAEEVEVAEVVRNYAYAMVEWQNKVKVKEPDLQKQE